jgi:hypothetical protein
VATDGWDALRELLERRCREHSPNLDSFLYNGGTVALLAATSMATFLSPSFDPDWVPRALTGFAAFWIALERALNFGGRWRYHRQMKAGYENVISRIELYTATAQQLTPDEVKEFRDSVASEITSLQQREADIPTGEPAPQPPSA